MNNLKEKYILEPSGLNYFNPKAKVVIVGITPGNSQMSGSRKGMSDREIKRTFAFAGTLRPNLVKMLDYIGINTYLHITTCATLWAEDFDKVDMTSLLKDATYELNSKGEKVMFRDTTKIAKSELLTRLFEDRFLKDCNQYENEVVFVACGRGVYDILKSLQKDNSIKGKVVGISHPSGANQGRIQCYIGKSEPKDSACQWCADKAIEARKIISSLVNQ